MDNLKKIVEECEINEKRHKKELNERKMLKISYLISRLKTNKKVATYAYLQDYDKLYQSKDILTQEEEKKFLEGQMQMSELIKDNSVELYCFLQNEYDRLKQECNEYYQAINIDLRNKISPLPSIFVYQGMYENTNYKLSRHIIDPKCCEVYEKTPTTVIYPEDDINSKKEARHFYNRISFKYLEELSKDYTFDPKVKRLGKVRIEEEL